MDSLKDKDYLWVEIKANFVLSVVSVELGTVIVLNFKRSLVHRLLGSLHKSKGMFY